MDMTDKDEQLIQQFMTTHRPEVADMGFTHWVMRHLPDRAARLSRLWAALCIVVGIVLTVVWGGLASVKDVVYDMIGDMVGMLSADGITMVPLGAVYMAIVVMSAVLLYNVVAAKR